MTLSINNDRTQISIVDELLNNFIDAPEDYSNIIIQIYYNSTTSSTSETYDVDNLITNVTNISTIGGDEFINPAFLNASVFNEGIYHILVTLTGEAQIETSEGCIFVEDAIACDINEYRLTSTIDLNKRLNAGIDYYMLTKSQSCTCGCDNLVEIYNNLITTIANNTCSTC